MKINFKKPFLNINGEPVKDGNKPMDLNEFLANSLASAQNTTEPVKFFDWGIKVFNEGWLELDKTDTEKLEKFITENGMPILGKGRLLTCIEEAKNEAKSAEVQAENKSTKK